MAPTLLGIPAAAPTPVDYVAADKWLRLPTLIISSSSDTHTHRPPSVSENSEIAE